MGRVNGPIVINVIEVAPGAFLNVLGKGLTLDADNKAVPNLGDGLTINSDNQIQVDAGSTLKFVDNKLQIRTKSIAGEGLDADEGKLNVKLGSGLELDDHNRINVYGHDDLAGEGLKVDDVDGKIDVKLGCGLHFNGDNEISVDPDAHFEMTLSFTVQTDTNLIVDGNILTLKKSYTRYDLQRNEGGIVVGIADHAKFERFESVTLPFGGYGYGCNALSISSRESSVEKPNFYKK